MSEPSNWPAKWTLNCINNTNRTTAADQMEIEFLTFPRKLERKLVLTFGGNQLPFKCSNTMRRQRSKRFGQSQAANTFHPPPSHGPENEKKNQVGIGVFRGAATRRIAGKSEWKIIWLQNLQPQENQNKKQNTKKPHVPASTVKEKKNFDQDREAEKKLRKRVACIEVAISHWRFAMLWACHHASCPCPTIYLGPLGCGCNNLLAVKSKRAEKRKTPVG